MKLCIVSDSHDRADALSEAVRVAVGEGAQAVIHCGDLIGAHTLRPALEFGIPIHLVFGNNLGDPAALFGLAQRSDGRLHVHGQCARLELAGRSVFAIHDHELGAAVATAGGWALVCCGHSHRAEIRRLSNALGGETWLVNPGTVAGIAAPPTWVFGDLAEMRFELRAV